MAVQQDRVAIADGDAVTRQEMVRLTGRSIDTIKRDVRDNGLTMLDGPNGTKLVLVSDFIRIGRLEPDAVPTGLTGPQAAELRRVTAENARLTALVGELTGRLEESRGSADLVMSQLAAKDAQIKALTVLLSKLVPE